MIIVSRKPGARHFDKNPVSGADISEHRCPSSSTRSPVVYRRTRPPCYESVPGIHYGEKKVV